MDAISQVLSGVKLNGALFFSAEFSAPWGFSMPAAERMTDRLAPGAEHIVLYHLLIEGSAVIEMEDASRLGRWLFGHDLEWETAGTEERVLLPAMVPVYVTYLTAMPEGSSIAFYSDVYGRDSARLAAISSAAFTRRKVRPACPMVVIHSFMETPARSRTARVNP